MSLLNRPADRDFVAPEGRKFILWAAILGASLGFIDGTVVALAMSAIRADLGATLDQAAWIQNAYMITLSALILTGGAFGDRFGLARVFKLGIALFISASLASALAPNASTLIVTRALQGVGAALMIPGSLSLVARAYPRADRGAAIGVWAAASGVTTALGPIIGGLVLSLGDDAMWRWIFVINLPFGFIAVGLLSRHVRQDQAKPGEKIDLIGAVLATLGLGLMAWAVTGAEGGFGSWPSIFFGLGGIVAFALFLNHERRLPHAMLPLGLFASRSFSSANIATFALYFGLTTVIFFLPMLVIAGWGISAIEATVAFAPLSICIALFSKSFGKLADRIGPGPLIAVGSLTITVAYYWLGWSVLDQLYWSGVIPPLILGGLGMSMVVAPLSTSIMRVASEGDTGAASGVNNAVSRIAGLFAVAIMGTVIGTSYRAVGGTVSYGVASDAPFHVDAMTLAFSTAVWVCAALSLFAAIIAAVGIRQKGLVT